MRSNTLIKRINEMENTIVLASGQREGAGKVYFEIGVKTDNPHKVASELKDIIEDTDWTLTNYAETNRGKDVGGPYGWDGEENREIPSNLRLKKNLYNEHEV